MSDDDFGFEEFDEATLAALDATDTSDFNHISLPSRPNSGNLSGASTKVSTDHEERPPKRFKPNNWRNDSPPVYSRHSADYSDFAVVASRDGKYRILDAADPNPRTSFLAVPSSVSPSPPFSEPKVEKDSGPISRLRSRGSISGSPTEVDTISAGPEKRALTPNYSSKLLEELSRLQSQLAELEASKGTIQKSLEQAIEANYLKDGEVSLLRRNIGKINAAHADALARAKAEKTAIEEKLIQAQKANKEEMERMRNSLVLRRQEIETSTRKSSWSTRKPTQNATTPLHAAPGLRIFGGGTPSKNPAPVPPKSGKGKGRTVRHQLVASAKKEPSNQDNKFAFPSFVNSFQSKTPAKSPSKSKSPKSRKRQERVNINLSTPPPLHQDIQDRSSPYGPRTRSQSSPLQAQRLDFGGADTSSPTRDGDRLWDNFMSDDIEVEAYFDAEMTGDLEPIQIEVGEPIDSAPLRDRVRIIIRLLRSLTIAEQLYNIILLHTTPPTNPHIPQQHTLQLLFSVPFLDNQDSDSIKAFTAVSALLEALSVRGVDLKVTLGAISGSLLDLAIIFFKKSEIVPLTSCLDLMATIVFYFPQAAEHLFGFGHEPAQITDLLGNIVRQHMNPKQTMSQEQESLSRELLRLLEIICFSAAPDTVARIKPFVLRPEVVSYLLNEKQPGWVIERTTRWLAILATYHSLFRMLLAFPDPQPDQASVRQDFTKIPLVERLCRLLNENHKLFKSMQSLNIQYSILIYMSQLALASNDSLALLVESQSVIPALVYSLHINCTRLWEDEERIPNLDMGLLLRQIVESTIHLLHYLVFKPEPPPNLHQRLQYPTHRSYAGLENMFIVGVGKLSYADAPEWLDQNGKEAIERSAELGRDLLEHVINGPDVDTIWAAYQDAQGSDNESIDETQGQRRSIFFDDDLDMG